VSPISVFTWLRSWCSHASDFRVHVDAISARELKERVDKADAQNETLEERIKALEANRRPLISGLTAEGTLFGFGLITMAGAFVVTRRRRSES
jgi:hypothetical protein